MSDATPPGPPVHPRDEAIEAAASEIVAFANAWHRRHELTLLEYLYILGVLQHRAVQDATLKEREAARDVL